MGWAFQFAPTGAFTLEANVIFSTYDLALTYATTDPTAVVGKVISVDSGEEKGVYMIEAIGESGSLKKVGSDIDLSNYVTKDQLTNIYTYKGTVVDYNALLALTNPAVGDVYNVEKEFTISKTTGEGEGAVTTSKTYPAGTNVAWTGTEWDPLGGSVDLSEYVTKTSYDQLSETVSSQGAKVLANEANIARNTAAISNKVDKNGTDRLITAAEGVAIAKIERLEAKDSNLESRLAVVEGFFSDSEGGELNLSGIQQQITTHDGAIQSLNTNKADKSVVTALEGRVTTAEGNIAELIAEDVKINSKCDGLVTRIEALEATDLTVSNTLSGYNERINANNTAIQALQSAGYLTASDIAGKADTTAVEAQVAQLNSTISSNLTEAKGYADQLKVTIDTAYAAADELILKAAKDYADEAAANVDFDDSALQTAIKANTDAIGVLNGSGDGSVSKQISDAISAFAGSINDNETIENLTELLAFANDHKDIADTVALAAANNTTLQTLTGNGTGSISKTVEDAVAVEKTRAEGVENSLLGKITAIESDYLKSSDQTAFEQLVSTEKNRAEGAEAGLSTRIAAIEADYLTSLEKNALKALIDNKVESSVYEAKITELEESLKDYTDAALDWISVDPVEPKV